MDIWSVREKSLDWLEKELHSESKVLLEGFNLLENLIYRFEELGNLEGESENGQFCRILSVTLAKLNHLFLGLYSLSLDGLAQESGAMLRPSIEAYELMVYLRQDSSRIAEVHDDKLPGAGEIAKKISGEFQKLRTYLSENASHFNYTEYSLGHLLKGNKKVCPLPSPSLTVLRKNLKILNGFQIIILNEATNCLSIICIDSTGIIEKIDVWRKKSIEVFPK